MNESDLSDAALVERLPGFANGYADVGDVRLHYVAGGQGEPLFLIGGWPQTWWEFRHVMPKLAERFRVVAVDMRGQGGSSKPEGGYDKKTIAADIHALAQQLGHSQIDIVGHDIGSMVAYSYVANHPESVKRAALLDIPHPFEVFLEIPLLPRPGSLDIDRTDRRSHAWWFAFNSIPDLPEKLLEGRAHLLLDWMYDYAAVNKGAITPFDRAVYAAAYEQPGAIRAGNALYKAFVRDIEDLATYAASTVPILGIVRPQNPLLGRFFDAHVKDAKLVEIPGCGHWIAEEKPAELLALLFEFFG